MPEDKPTIKFTAKVVPPKSEKLQLYVESDGHLFNTRVFDQYGRELICRSVQWRVEGGRKGEEIGIVTIELYNVEVKINHQKAKKDGGADRASHSEEVQT